METNLYSGVSWIFSRLVVHVFLIASFLYALLIVTESITLVLSISVVVIILYALVVFAHFRLPIASIDSNFITVRNYFYTGKSRLALQDIQQVEVRAHSIRLISSVVTEVPLRGMPLTYKQFFKEKFGKTSAAKGIKVIDPSSD